MSGAAAQAVEPRPAAADAAAASPATTTSQAVAKGGGGCNPVRKPGPATMEHVLLALHETEAEHEARIRGMFGFFDASRRGHLDHAQIEAGFAALRVLDGGGGGNKDYARELLRACDRDGRIGYDDFRRYMDDKELKLYRIFQAIDVEHNGCIGGVCVGAGWGSGFNA